jgi:tetratricopeptide (TPR) repeat protein
MPRSKKRPKGWLTSTVQVDNWLDQASQQIGNKKYDEAIRTCQRILRYIPKNDKVRAETLGILGTAYVMGKSFDQAYQAFDQAVQIDPDEPYLWYNYGLVCLYTNRSGKSLRALERGLSLAKDKKIGADIQEKLEMVQKVVDSETKMRGPDFTLDQLVEQQDLFQLGIGLASQEKWTEAENVYRAVIAMGDCLPQPWSNLGIVLVMQKRWDEAEAAYCRALEIEPAYEMAKTNLANLTRQREDPDFKPIYKVTYPYDEVETSIIYKEEE